MPDIFKPATLDQLRDVIAAASSSNTTLELRGGGSKAGLGRPVQAAATLDLAALSAIRTYEPEELILTAAAATPLKEIEAALAAKRQMLAFEPPDFGALLGSGSTGTPLSSGTLGGVLAANLAGPRRVSAGAARDHFLGVVAVNGRGEVFRAGGKVVKNVTGYDLCKLLAGSFGTLAAIEEATVKVLPAPEKTRTALVLGLDPASALAAMSEALSQPVDVTAAAYLPQAVAARSAVGYVAKAGTTITALRVEGTGESAAARCKALCGRLSHLGTVEELHSHNSAILWREVRDVAALLSDAARAIWRVSLPPTASPAFLDAIAPLAPDYYLDWGGGLVWLAIGAVGAAMGDCGAAAIRAAIAISGGHATLIRASAPARAAIEVFQPLDAGLAALTARIKQGFDPGRILNPGRMYADV